MASQSDSTQSDPLGEVVRRLEAVFELKQQNDDELKLQYDELKALGVQVLKYLKDESMSTITVTRLIGLTVTLVFAIRNKTKLKDLSVGDVMKWFFETGLYEGVMKVLTLRFMVEYRSGDLEEEEEDPDLYSLFAVLDAEALFKHPRLILEFIMQIFIDNIAICMENLEREEYQPLFQQLERAFIRI